MCGDKLALRCKGQSVLHLRPDTDTCLLEQARVPLAGGGQTDGSENRGSWIGGLWPDWPLISSCGAAGGTASSSAKTFSLECASRLRATSTALQAVAHCDGQLELWLRALRWSRQLSLRKPRPNQRISKRVQVPIF